MKRRMLPGGAFGWTLVLVGLACSRCAIAAEAIPYDKFLAERGPMLVTVKFVLKVSMGSMFGGDEETDTEITGVMIDAKGLVLCSNTQLGGFIGMLKSMMGSMGGEMSATPTDLKVLVGDDTEGRDAELIARDTELDLAWVRIKEPGEKEYAYVDFAKSAKPAIGDTVISIRRLGKFFARSAVVAEGRIGGTTSKPRELLIPTGGLAGGLGAPVFDASGKPVGVMVMQAPEAEDSGGNPMAMLGRMSGMQDMMSGFLLPADIVVKATERALATVAPEPVKTD